MREAVQYSLPEHPAMAPRNAPTFLVQTACKINLSLLVYQALIPSGYHPLCSVFQALNWYDSLFIQVKPKSQGLVIRCPDYPDLEKHNLLHRLYATFQNDIPFGFDIDLHKNIPMGAGLGGGSGNAAGFLLFLNQVSGWKKSTKALIDMGKTVGADIPFFLKTSPALVRGIGEKITPLPHTKRKYYVLIYPGLHITTQQIFKAFDRLPRKKVGPVPRSILQHHIGPNDLTLTAYDLEPNLKIFEQQCFDLGLPNLQMTGSGSAHFSFFPSLKEADFWAQKLKDTFPSYRVKSLRPIRHPILMKATQPL